MAIDLFNNNSNDWIRSDLDLPTCPGSSDSYEFKFLPGQEVGIVSGSSVLLSMSFADFGQSVTGWVQQKKLLESGEVVFIQGLTKGITNQSETFYTTDASILDASVAGYYAVVDMSIGVYKNFKYTVYDVSAQSDYINGVDIENALNIVLGNKDINVTVSYDDASTFIISAGTAGYTFGDTAIHFEVDNSSGDTFSINLIKNDAVTIPAFKYPNTAMLGYMFKVNYPLSITTESSKYINLNHVPDFLTYYDVSTGDTNSYVKWIKAVDVGRNGTSDNTTLSAGDYLYHIDINNKWEKVGPFRAWIGTSDPDSSNVENLVTGFYLFNPQTFAVQIEYIVII